MSIHTGELSTGLIHVTSVINDHTHWGSINMFINMFIGVISLIYKIYSCNQSYHINANLYWRQHTV